MPGSVALATSPDVVAPRGDVPALPTGTASSTSPPAPKPAQSEAQYGSLRTSYRVLLHVARQGRTPPGDIPPLGLTQKGMIDALGVNQGTLAGPLQRLVLSGALTVERGHARGADRRVKVYRLTPLGERLVDDLRKRDRAKTAASSERRPTPP